MPRMSLITSSSSAKSVGPGPAPATPPTRTGNRSTVVKKSRWALLKNLGKPGREQTVTLRLIELEDPAYLIKESLRLTFQMKYDDAGRGACAVDRLGASLPTFRVRRVTEKHRHSPRLQPGRQRTRPLQRPDRIGQHQEPDHHPRRVRIPRAPKALYRPGQTQPRQSTTTTPQKETPKETLIEESVGGPLNGISRSQMSYS